MRAGTKPERRAPRPGLGPLAGLAATISILLQLLHTPVIGLANNGDYGRVLDPLGLAARVPKGSPAKFAYIWPFYDPQPVSGTNYQSTERVLVQAMHVGYRLLGLGDGFDLRAVGAAQAVLLGVAVWLIVRALPGGSVLRGVTALLLVVVLTDTRFAVYLASFYTEPASLLALLFLVAAVLHAFWGRLSLLGLGAILLAAAALLVSKSADSPLAWAIVVLVLVRRVEVPRLGLTGTLRGRLLPGTGAVLLLVLAAGYLLQQPADLSRDNRYNAVFVEILGHSTDRGADLRALGLSPSLARYARRPIYVSPNATGDPAFAGFFDRVTETSLVRYYATHPGRSAQLAARGMRAAATLRLVGGPSPPLGNYEQSAGRAPYASACKLCLFSRTSLALRDASVALVPALWLAACALGTACLRPGRRRHRVTGPGQDKRTSGPLGAVLLLLVGIAVTSFVIALLGEGEFEIVKHLYLTSATDAVLAVLSFAAAGLLLSDRLHRIPRAHLHAAPPSSPPQRGVFLTTRLRQWLMTASGVQPSPRQGSRAGS